MFLSVSVSFSQSYNKVDDGYIELGDITDIEYLDNHSVVVLSNSRIYQVNFDDSLNYSIKRLYNPYDNFTKLFKIDRNRDGLMDICAYRPNGEQGVSFFLNDS